MNRKSFLKQSSLATVGFYITHDLFAKDRGPVYGHNDFRYRMNTKWSKANPLTTPVQDCHEMVIDAKGRIILLTNETKNNILIFNSSGKLIETWGHSFPGGHGLSLTNENGTEFLFITDTVKHQVYKTTLDGTIILTIDPPTDIGIYNNADEFVPTEVAVGKSGDFFIADGYGKQFVLHYDKNAKLIGFFGGRGEGSQHLDNAHGICLDERNNQQSLLVTDRTRKCFKRFSLDGELLEVISIPGACVCRPVIKNDHLYSAVLRSPKIDMPGTGFTTILDSQNKVVSNLGGTKPVYEGGVLQPLSQAEKIFIHPHDVCIDNDENLYVSQWASGKVYPYKFTRV